MHVPRVRGWHVIDIVSRAEIQKQIPLRGILSRLNNVSRALVTYLRHRTNIDIREKFEGGVSLTCCGRMVWREQDQTFDPFWLMWAMTSGDKPRFAVYFDTQKDLVTHIRAVQGHSRDGITQASLGSKQLISTDLPQYAYHGTKEALVILIAEKGIVPGGLLKTGGRPEAYLTTTPPWQDIEAFLA